MSIIYFYQTEMLVRRGRMNTLGKVAEFKAIVHASFITTIAVILRPLTVFCNLYNVFPHLILSLFEVCHPLYYELHSQVVMMVKVGGLEENPTL